MHEPDSHSAKVNVSRYKNNAWQYIEDLAGIECPVFIRLALATAASNIQEATIWGATHNLPTLVIGHALLDLAPAANCLNRQITLEKIAIPEKHKQPAGFGFSIIIGPDKPTDAQPEPSPVPAKVILAAMRSFISAGGLWEETGCFHRAGIFDPASNQLLFRAEDIGRHNCVDRLAGWSVLHEVPLHDKVLLLSARLTASLCAKALRAGFKILVSRSAVTTSAMQMCAEAGAALVAFARPEENRFSVFEDSQRRIADA